MDPRNIFDPEHELFRDNVKKFFKRELAPHLEHWEAANRCDRSLFVAAGEAGLLCPQASGDYGGSDADTLYSAIVVEEAAALSHHGLSLSMHSDVVSEALVRIGAEQVRLAFLPKMAAGEMIGAWAIDEDNGAAGLEYVATTAVRDGDHYVLKGAKRFVINGSYCDIAVVLASTNPAAGNQGLSLFVVETSAPGVTKQGPLKKPGLKSLDVADLIFDNVRVPAAHLLGGENDGLRHAAVGQLWERLMYAVSAVAAAEAALRSTVEYVRDRHAFGQTIMGFQNTRFVLAEQKTQLAMARGFVDWCLVQLLDGQLDMSSAAKAKWWCTELLGNVTDACVQLHGGYGYMWEYAIARAYADARALRLYGGTAEAMKNIVVSSDLALWKDAPAEYDMASGAAPGQRPAGRVELSPLPYTTPGWWRDSEQTEGEYRCFLERLQNFFDNKVLPKFEQWEAQSGFDRSLFSDAGKAGLLCTTVPVQYGGQGLGRETAVGVLELGSAYSNVGLALSMHSEIVSGYLLNFGSEELKHRWLPLMARGEAIGALGMSEPSAGSDLKALRTTARRDGDHYVLSGSKIFISNGGVCDFVIVAAKTDSTAGAKGISLLLVDATLPGFRQGRRLNKVGLKSQDTAELFFDEVRVPVACLLGEENQGFAYMMKELPWERLQIALTCVGAVVSALNWTVEFLRKCGRTNGADVCSQNTRLKLAELLTEAHIGRTFIDRCVKLLQQGELDALTSTMAKLWFSEWHGRTVDGCVELLGPSAYQWDNPVGRAYVDARAQRIYGGASEIMKELISRSL